MMIMKGINCMAQIISEKQDLTWLSWTKIRESSGTAGSFMKAYSDLSGKKIYYKLSNYNASDGIIGHECVNEIIADRLLTILGIEHLSYQLIRADILIDGQKTETWLCASEDFKQYGDSKMTLETYYQQERLPRESALDFCIRQGWSEYIWKMLITDYLILNRDRHGANIEVLRNRVNRTIRLAPLFDHGLSFVCRCTTEEELAQFDVMKDLRVQCFAGGSSAWENLKLIPKGSRPVLGLLKAEDKSRLFDGLEDALPEAWREKIWDMIWMRWNAYADLCHS